MAEWSEGLRGMTPEQIRRGLAWDGEWPPTLPEFRNACRGVGSGKNGKNEFGLNYVPEYYRAAPVTDKRRLLSSDDRDRRRQEAVAGLGLLRQKLLGGGS